MLRAFICDLLHFHSPYRLRAKMKSLVTATRTVKWFPTHSFTIDVYLWYYDATQRRFCTSLVIRNCRFGLFKWSKKTLVWRILLRHGSITSSCDFFCFIRGKSFWLDKIFVLLYSCRLETKLSLENWNFNH